MRLAPVLALALCLIAIPASAAPRHKGGHNHNKVHVRQYESTFLGFGWGTTQDDVVAQLGEPNEVIPDPDNNQQTDHYVVGNGSVSLEFVYTLGDPRVTNIELHLNPDADGGFSTGLDTLDALGFADTNLGLIGHSPLEVRKRLDKPFEDHTREHARVGWLTYPLIQGRGQLYFDFPADTGRCTGLAVAYTYN